MRDLGFLRRFLDQLRLHTTIKVADRDSEFLRISKRDVGAVLMPQTKVGILPGFKISAAIVSARDQSFMC